MIDIIKPLVIGIVLTGLFVIVPVIALLTEHQRKMAALIRNHPDEQLRGEMDSLRAEVKELRARQTAVQELDGDFESLRVR